MPSEIRGADRCWTRHHSEYLIYVAWANGEELISWLLGAVEFCNCVERMILPFFRSRGKGTLSVGTGLTLDQACRNFHGDDI